MKNNHRIDVFSDGSVSLVSVSGSLTLSVVKDTVGSPVASIDTTEEEIAVLDEQDLTALKFDLDSKKFTIDEGETVIALRKKDITIHDPLIEHTSQANVVVDTGPAAAEINE